jgi:hypothetical protein
MNHVCYCCQTTNLDTICTECLMGYNKKSNLYRKGIEGNLDLIKGKYKKFYLDNLRQMEKFKRIKLGRISYLTLSKSSEELQKSLEERGQLVAQLKEKVKKRRENQEVVKKLISECWNYTKGLGKLPTGVPKNYTMLKKQFVNNLLDTVMNYSDVKNLNDYLEIQTLTHLNTNNNNNADIFEQINNQLSEFRGYIVELRETTVRYLTFKQNIDRYSVITLNKYIYKVLYFLELMMILLPIDLPYIPNPRKLTIRDHNGNDIDIMYEHANIPKDIITGYQLIEWDLRELQSCIELNPLKVDIYDLKNFLNIRKLYTGDGKLKYLEHFEIVSSDLVIIDDYFKEK